MKLEFDVPRPNTATIQFRIDPDTKKMLTAVRMPKLKAKYKFTDNDSIIDIIENIITDPKDVQQFKLAFKYPNGLPRRFH